MTQEEFDRALTEKRAREEALAASFAVVPDSEIEALLREFIACKYFLLPEDLKRNDLIALGNLSTARMAGYQQAGIQFREKSAGCTTASSGVIKKVLLAIAIGKLIGKKLDPDAVAQVETVPQMAELIVQTRRSR